ncbi:MAG: hypothetical protein AB7U61_13705, partial [Methylocystis sp.]
QKTATKCWGTQENRRDMLWEGVSCRVLGGRPVIKSGALESRFSLHRRIAAEKIEKCSHMNIGAKVSSSFETPASRAPQDEETTGRDG